MHLAPAVNLASELRAISQFYWEFQEELAVIDAADPNDSRAYIRSIFRKRDCLARIEQVNSRALQLCKSWKTCRPALSSESRREMDELVELLRRQAAGLYELCEKQICKIQSAKQEFTKGLVELGKGARYLKSVKPANNNYPKFIDSHC